MEEDMNARHIDLYLNTETGRIVYGFEPWAEITRPDELPQIYNGETVVLCVNCIDSTGQPVPLNAADTFEAAIDTNYLHTDELMAYSAADQVDISGDWDQIDRTAGRISIRIDAATTGFAEKIGTAATVSALLEIKRYVSGGTGFSVICQDTVIARNTVLDGEGAPTPADPEYYTAAQTEALLAGYATPADVDTALLPYAKTTDVNSAIAAAQNAAATTYLPFTGGNITGGLTVGDNPVTALPVGTVAGTLYVGASREFTTIAAALDHIRQSSNGLDKVWNILLDPGEYTLSGVITGLNLSFAPVSGSYSTDCRIVGGVTFQDSNITLANMHIGTESLSSGTASILVNCGYFTAENCVFYAGANTVGYSLRFDFCATGQVRNCKFYAPTATPSGSFLSLMCQYSSAVYLSGSEGAFVGTSGVTGTYAIQARTGACVFLYGRISVTDYATGIWCRERSCCFGQGGSFTFSGVTTNSSPADGTVGNDNSYINI